MRAWAETRRTIRGQTLYERYAQDSEAAVSYALGLNITALPTDKTYAYQLKAVDILDQISAKRPDHPGVLHYLMHSLDYPPLAGAVGERQGRPRK